MTKTKGRKSVLLVFFVVIILCFSVGFYSWLNIETKQKMEKYNELEAQLAGIVQENDNINDLLNNEDKSDLYERLARERGYIYPDEKVFIDITPGR